MYCRLLAKLFWEVTIFTFFLNDSHYIVYHFLFVAIFCSVGKVVLFRKATKASALEGRQFMACMIDSPILVYPALYFSVLVYTN
jgi:hypothetical protein